MAEAKKQKQNTKRVYLEMPPDMAAKALSLSKQLHFTTLNAFIRHLVRQRLIEAGLIEATIKSDLPTNINEIDGD